MSRIFKRDAIKIDDDNKVSIVHDNLPDNVRMFEDSEDVDYHFDYKKAVEVANIMAEGIIDSAQKEADTIMQEAIMEADRIIEDAEANKENILEEFRTNGFEEGYKAGYEDGQGAGLAEYESKLAQVDEEIQKAIDDRANIIDNTEAEIVDLILDVVANLTYGAFRLNPELLTVLVKRGISNATIQKKVSIKVSSEDYDDVVKHIDGFKQLIDSSKDVEVLKDFSLMKNDCMLETEFGNINCGLDEQLESLKEAMYFVLNNK